MANYHIDQSPATPHYPGLSVQSLGKIRKNMPWLPICTFRISSPKNENLEKFCVTEEVLSIREVLMAVLIPLCQIPELTFILRSVLFQNGLEIHLFWLAE